MTREEAKDLLPIIQAYAEGKVIESRCIKGDKSLWYDDEDPSFDNDFEYRLKSEQKYRPFKDAEECWDEMQKHQPFGWVNYNGYRANIAAVMGSAITFVNNKGYTLFFQQAFEGCTFIDKQPFGIKEDKYE